MLALVLILAAVPFVSSVAAYRSAHTPNPSPAVDCPQAPVANAQGGDQAVPQQCSRSTAQIGDGDGDRGGHESGALGRQGGGVTIMTHSSAS